MKCKVDSLKHIVVYSVHQSNKKLKKSFVGGYGGKMKTGRVKHSFPPKIIHKTIELPTKKSEFERLK